MRTSHLLARIAVVAGALALAGLCPAPINDPSARRPWTKEQTQSQLQREQGYNGTQGVVGQVQIDERRNEDLRQSGQPGAADSIAAASRESEASNAIAEASSRLEGKPESHGMPWWLLAAIVGGGAFAVVWGLRSWADKALPTPQHLK